MKETIVKLIEEKKYNDLKRKLKGITCQDLSLIFNDLSKEQMILTYRLLSKDMAVDTFTYMDSDLQEALISALTDIELKAIIDDLFMDDTVDLIEEMPSNVVKRILKNVSKTDRKIINELLKYADDTVGSIMTTEFTDLKSYMTVEEAFTRIKKIGVDKETIYTCYVLDESRKLIGVVTAKDLLLAERDIKIADIMDTNIISIHTNDDQEEVGKMFDKYDLLALPVVDLENRLVGIVTIDDAIDVIQEENTEDFEKMAAMAPSEDSYLKTPFYIHAKNRIIWLLLLMLSSAVTGTIITKYEVAFASLPVLVSFIPMIMGTGGNCGSQSSTMAIRGLALDEIKFKDIFKVMKKETLISIMVGIILAIVNGIRIIIFYKDIKLAIVLGLTLIGTVLLAKLLGCVLPMVAKKLKLDPAIMAAPLITTIVDTCSILIYFKIAMLLLNL